MSTIACPRCDIKRANERSRDINESQTSTHFAWLTIRVTKRRRRSNCFIS